ncbi:hypothetical protein EG329_011948 [Mollisiaceae sp. DMI_Dod_QoI]|nr:hypothetical protein EG329_011948 [Helotiales sp. DMI_Dod_QoI]
MPAQRQDQIVDAELQLELNQLKRQNDPENPPNHYLNIFVHLLSWDDAVDIEIAYLNRIGDAFQAWFNYTIFPLRIPQNNSTECVKAYFGHHQELFVDKHTLNIVYYVPTLYSRCGPSMPWRTIQEAFDPMEGDVLFILETCYAAGAAIQGITTTATPTPENKGKRQLLAGAGFSQTAPTEAWISFNASFLDTLNNFSTNDDQVHTAHDLEEGIFQRLGVRYQSYQLMQSYDIHRETGFEEDAPATPVFKILDRLEGQEQEPIQLQVLRDRRGRRVQLRLPLTPQLLEPRDGNMRLLMRGLIV